MINLHASNIPEILWEDEGVLGGDDDPVVVDVRHLQ